MKVAAYCREYVEQDDQEGSIANQKEHYEELIQNNPDYVLTGIYHDNGKSGFYGKPAWIPGDDGGLQSRKD